MNKRELCSILQNQTMNPKRLKETQEMCSALIEEQMKLDILPEERTDFWQFLSDVMRHTGWLAAVGNPGNSVAAGLCRDFFCFRKSPDYSDVYAPVYISLSAIFLPEYCLWNEGTGSRYQSFQCADHSS